MKTKIYILATLMLLSVNILSAKGTVSPASDGYETITIPSGLLLILAPETPKEASFEDVLSVENMLLIETLAPVTPAVADFDDMITESIPDVSNLKPVLPLEADFEDQL
jgi:hypothetical protein